MKTLKLILCLFVLIMATPTFAQVPPPEGVDYCDCLDGVQGELEECPCVSTGNNNSSSNNNNNNNNNNGNGETPNPSNDGGMGGIATGNFPMVISWLECFFDPDCDP